ncbi:MAG: 3'-5' exonuclease [Variovorax sp.]
MTRTPPPLPPGREEIALLDVFQGLEMPDIELVATAEDAARALAALGRIDVVGFDTESKPTFLKNEVSTGPHTLQLSTLDHAWVFQLHDADCRAAAASLIASSALTKVGFGLDGDRTQIRAKLGIEPQAVIDLDLVFRRRGYRNSIGVKTAVALLFNQRFLKSRKQTTSNWATRHLSEGQLRYAANDAYAAMRVFVALGAETHPFRHTPAQSNHDQRIE